MMRVRRHIMRPLLAAPRDVVRLPASLFTRAQRQTILQSRSFTATTSRPDAESKSSAPATGEQSSPGADQEVPRIIRETKITTRIPNNSAISRGLNASADVLQQKRPRLVSEITGRIGKCVMFGMTPEQTREAAEILRILATDWRELIAGVDGFDTQKAKCGLWRHGVVWGEMVSHF